MCYRPLRIVNPVKNPTFRDKLYIEVPCGTCKQCRDRKVNEFAARAYFESLYTKKLNGRILYCTFTFSHANIPRVSYHGKMIPCFDKTLIQKFLKLLRKKLGYNKVRYIITSEFGDDSNLPHHHSIIYFNEYVPDRDLMTLIMDIKEVWQGIRKWKVDDCDVPLLKRGICKIEEVNSYRAFYYTCKYINKQISTHFDDMPPECQPFHLQSKGFGLYIIDYFGFKNDASICRNMQSIIDGTISLPYGKISVLPQYISRKLLFDYEYQYVTETIDDKLTRKKVIVSYHLNDFGKYIKSQRLYRSIDQTAQEVKDVLSYNNILSINVREANRYLHSNFNNSSEIYDFVKRYLSNDKDISNFALYISTFKDRLLIPYSNDGLFSPFGISRSETDFKNYGCKEAKDYIDFLFSSDIEYFDSYRDVKSPYSAKSWRFQNYIDTVSSSLYNCYFPQDYDLICNILNYLLFAASDKLDQRYRQSELFHDQAKLINPLKVF